MQSGDEDARGFQVHDLLLACASGSKGVEETAAAITDFSKSDSAPDAPVLSDLLLDTLFLYDTGVSGDDEEILNSQRQFLGSLVSKLIEGGCINEQDAYGRLEAPLLYAAKLIPDSKAFEKKHVRINTNLLYKQQKFNLFREDNEGYSKLIVEFETFLLTTANAHDDDKAQQLLTNIQSLIGYFDLDPNRVLDVIVELVSASILTHWRFLLPILKMSPWFFVEPTKERDVMNSESMLQMRSGNTAAAQIIGFRFQHAKHFVDEDKNFVMLTALLIKEGLLRLQDVWPHLTPDDSAITKEKALYQERILDEVDKARGRNALAMASSLDDDDTKLSESKSNQIDENIVDESPKVNDSQKIELLYALLCIGALQEALFVLSHYPFLLSSHTHLADALTVVLEQIIEPLWETLRPHTVYAADVRSNLDQFKKIPEEPKYRDSALISPKKPQVVQVLDPRQKASNAKICEHFFYDEVRNQLQVCATHDDFVATVLPYLKLLGLQIYRNVKLCTKVARIGKAALLATTDIESTRSVWQLILRTNLLPALSLLDTNPAIVNDIYNLVKEYNTEERYALYGEWYTDSYKKLPELKVQFVRSEKDTKSLLRRISKTNTKEYGRRLAKVSHTNPCIVLNIALNQIESYDNLVDVVIEASRYFTLLTFDVLVYVMLTLLSNTQKRRLKEDGTSVAHWLQSLSSFTAKIFKRYSHMDVSPVAIYVAKQLKMNNAFDLIILRDLINEMAGIRPTYDLSEDQLQGCTGGPFLRVEALALINERRDASAKAPLRLLHALDKVKLIHSLPILIGQQRSYCVYTVPEDQSLVKLLANLSDEVHQILMQFLEFLVLNVDPADYAVATSTVVDMVLQTSLEPCVAFMIARPAIAASIHAYTKDIEPGPASSKTSLQTEDTPAGSNSEPAVPASDASIIISGNIVAETDIMEVDGITQSLPPVVQDLARTITKVLPDDVWQLLTPILYTTFWSLSLYDLIVPVTRYEKAIAALQSQIKDINEDKADVTLFVEKNKVQETARLQSIVEQIRSEQTFQQHNSVVVSDFFSSGKDDWFDSAKLSNVSEATTKDACIYALLQHCLLPRCLISPNDATYCAEFLAKLQENHFQGLDLLYVYKALYSSHLATTIFCCTERESENLGRFLSHVLMSLNKFSEDQALYESSSLHQGTAEESDGASDTGRTWKEYNSTWYDCFHRSLWTNVKACFESKEYMHLRNLLIVLEKMQAAFPYFRWIGSNIEKEVDKLISTERREDLKIRALGYKAVLKKQHSRWREVPGKQISSVPVVTSVDSAVDAVENTSALGEIANRESLPAEPEGSKSLDPLAPAFEAGNTKTTPPNEEAPASDNAIAKSTIELQKEKARRAAASLTQALKEKPRESHPVPGAVDKADVQATSRDSKGVPDDRSRAPSSKGSSRAASPNAVRTSQQTQRDLQTLGPSRSADDQSRRSSGRHPPIGENGTPQSRTRDHTTSYTRRDDSYRSDRRPHSDDRRMPPPIDLDAGRLNDSQAATPRPRSSRAGPDALRRDEREHPAESNTTVSGSRAQHGRGDTPAGPRGDRAAADRAPSRVENLPQPITSGDGRLERESRPAEFHPYAKSTKSQDRPAAAFRNTSESSRNHSIVNESVQRVPANGPNAAPAQVEQNHFIHPSRLSGNATTSASTARVRTPPRAPSESVSAATEPVVHSSRQAIIERNTSDTARPDQTESRSSAGPGRSIRGADGSSRTRPAARGNNSNTDDNPPIRDLRDRLPPRDVDMRGQRTASRELPRNGHPDAVGHQRGERRDRPVEGYDTRRNRGSGGFGGPDTGYREEHDAKRRHVTDARDNQRPTKRR